MRSLRTTVALIVAVTVALTVTGLAVGVWVVTRGILLSSVDSSLQSRLEAGIYLDPVEDDPAVVRPPVPGQPTVIVDAVLADGEVFEVSSETFGLPATREDELVAVSPPGSFAYSTRFADDGTQVRVYTVSVVEGAAARAMRSLTETNAILARLAALLIVGGVLAVAVGATAGVLAVRRSTTPLSEVSEAMRALSRGRRDAEPPTAKRGAPREVVDVVAATTTLQEALARSHAQQERLVQDAGHELRTPLASLRANVQFAARTATDDLTRDSLTAAEAELDELGRMVEELLLLAARDEPVRPRSEIDVVEAVRSAVQRVERRTGRIVVLEVPDGRVPLVTDPMGLAEIVGNLLDNATKFARDPIVASVERHADAVVIEVRDGGPGIPLESRAAMFERFHRAPESRGKPGSGLGLSIVRRLTEAAGGVVMLDDAPEGGLAARVALPLRPPAEDRA